MIYEIQVRPAANKSMSSDQLIWIESSLPTRSFEQWLVSKSLLNGTSNAPVVRWSVVQSDRPAHFQLATQMAALENRIAELMAGSPEIREKPEAESESVARVSVANGYGAFLNRLTRGASAAPLVAAGW